MSSNLGCYTTSISMAHPSWWTSCTDSGWEQQVFGQVSIPSPQMPGRAVHATMEMSRMSAMWCSTALRIHIFGSSLCSPTLFMFSPQTGFQLFSMSQSSIRLHVFLARSCGAEPPSRTLPRLKLLSSHVHVCLVPSRLVLCLSSWRGRSLWCLQSVLLSPLCFLAVYLLPCWSSILSCLVLVVLLSPCPHS